MAIRLMTLPPGPIPRLFGLLGLGLMGWHLVLIQKITGNPDQLVLSLLFWGAIMTLGRRQLPQRLTQAYGALALGTAMLCILVFASWSLQAGESALVRLFPLFAYGGWSLMGRGWRMVPWWPTWALVMALSVPPRALPWLLEHTLGDPIRATTAAVAAFGLHYLGFEVVYQGSLIQLPAGTVDVEFACTGAALLGLLLQVSVLLAAVTAWQRLGPLVGWSVAIAALLSTIRVAIMATVVSHADTFQFWHGGGGGQIFTVLALVMLASLGVKRPEGREFKHGG